jgi:hypothetical protein
VGGLNKGFINFMCYVLHTLLAGMYTEVNNHSLFQDINLYCQELRRKIVISPVTIQSLKVTKKQCDHIPIFPEIQLATIYRRITAGHCIKQGQHICIKLQGIYPNTVVLPYH